MGQTPEAGEDARLTAPCSPPTHPGKTFWLGQEPVSSLQIKRHCPQPLNSEIKDWGCGLTLLPKFSQRLQGPRQQGGVEGLGGGGGVQPLDMGALQVVIDGRHLLQVQGQFA